MGRSDCSKFKFQSTMEKTLNSVLHDALNLQHLTLKQQKNVSNPIMQLDDVRFYLKLIYMM